MEERADKGKTFDTVFAILKETKAAFFANSISGIALLLTSLGMVLAHDKIKPILEINSIYVISIVVLVVFLITYSRFLLEIKRKTANLVRRLNELGYMDKQYFQDYEISVTAFIPMITAIMVMFVVMISVLS